jgi:hypothetical protein
MRLGFIVAAIWLFLATGSALAHHAFAAEFDANKPLKLTGAVTKVDWRNPHAWFYIDVTDGPSKVTNWGLEMGSPNGLMRAGWTKNSLKVGEIVLVEASQARDGSNIGNARSVTIVSTGQKLFTGSSQGRQ